MAQAAQQQPHPRANRQHPRRGIRINLTVDSRDGNEREVFAHAPVPASAKKKHPSSGDSPDPSQQADRQPTDFDEPAPLPQEEADEEDKGEKLKKGKGTHQERGHAEEPRGTEEDEAYRPFSKTGEEEDEDEFGQQGSGGDTGENQREGGESGEEQDRQQSDQQGKGRAAGDAQAQNAERGADQSDDRQGTDGDSGQKGRQSRQQKAAAAKAEAEKNTISTASEASERKLDPGFLITKELFLDWMWRLALPTLGLTLIPISFYYITIFCFHPPGWCEPGEEFDIPGDKTARNTLFTVGVLALTLIVIGIIGALLVLIIFLSMCANPAGFIANWGPCLEAFRTVK